MSLQDLIRALRLELISMGCSIAGSGEYWRHVENAANIRQKIKDVETSIEKRTTTIGNYKNRLN